MATGLVVVSGLLTGTASAESSSTPREAALEARIKELKNRIMLLERRLTGAGVKACGAPEPSRSVRVARPPVKIRGKPAASGPPASPQPPAVAAVAAVTTAPASPRNGAYRAGWFDPDGRLARSMRSSGACDCHRS